MGEKSDIDFSQEYFTFVVLEGGTFSLSTNDVYYSVDKGATWSLLAAGTQSPTIAQGNAIMWKGELTPLGNRGVGTFSSTGMFDAQGNPMSLLYGDDFKDKALKRYAFFSLLNNSKIVNAANVSLPATTLMNYCYQSMFANCTSLVSVPILPATTLGESCYQAMFYNCTSLTTAPALPATTLVSSCYNIMFYGCTSLTTPPELPATTLATSCYYAMFNNCRNLVSAPTLPATTLASRCYERMFFGCKSLNYIKCIATDMSASHCFDYWVMNVSTTGTFVKDSSATWVIGVSGIPEGWTIENA